MTQICEFESLNTLYSFRDWVRWSSTTFRRAELFYGHGTSTDWEEASYIGLWVIAQPWQRLDDMWDAHLSETEKTRWYAAVRRRVNERWPAAYITGEAWFAGARFVVNENVLVPRSPIAELIAAQFQPWLREYPESILDLCTGSGCIGIACAHEFEDARVDLVDISTDALDVANKNIALHGLNERVTAIESDALTALSGRQYRLIVSNPPYVSEEEYETLPAEFLVEPKLGLTSGEDGFDFVRALLLNAHEYLLDEGLLVVEVGHDWERFMATFPEYPFFWPEFEHGGCGVFVLSKEQLLEAHGRKAL